jgi:hypothetical protein
LGAGGGELGYTGISKSVAVSFDLYDNDTGANISAVGVFTNGTSPNKPEFPIVPLDFHSGDAFLATLSYDGTTLSVTIKDTVTNQTQTQTFPVDIAGVIESPTAYVGFTASTGGLVATQQLLSWSYSVLPSYPNGFADTTGLQSTGTGTAISGTKLQLTQGNTSERTSTYYTSPVPITAFTTTFNFQDVGAQADGFTFVLQNSGLTALGAGGGELGYADILKSVAVSFDLYDNDTGANISAVGVFTNGTSPNKPEVSFAPLDFHSGNVFLVTLSYDGTTLSVTIKDTITSQTKTQTYPVDITGSVGGPMAYVGFTASTGGLVATQQLLSWSYSIK